MRISSQIFYPFGHFPDAISRNWLDSGDGSLGISAGADAVTGVCAKKDLRFGSDWGGIYMVRPERFELPTLWFVAKYSIQLSYGRTQLVSSETIDRLTGNLSG